MWLCAPEAPTITSLLTGKALTGHINCSGIPLPWSRPHPETVDVPVPSFRPGSLP
jgi:hypothetical protein